MAPISWHQFPGIYAQNKIKQLDFSAKYPSSVEMGISMLKAIQIVRNSSTFRIFEILNFIMLKMISRGYEDYKGLSAVVPNSEGATCSDFQQVAQSRNFRLFMLKMISRGYE